MVVVAGVEVERVEYTYKGLDVETGLSLAIGSDGDLVQVVKSVLVDLAPAGSSPWHRTVTQYRYFHEDFVDEDEEEAEDDLDGDGFAHEFGNPHQLKAVILPAQLEYAARHATTGTPDDETVVAFATALLALDDGDVAFNDGDDRIVMNLAAKVVERYELFDPNDPEVDRGRVMVQYLQSACGCAGGSAQGLKLEYTYWHEYASSPDDGDFARTTVVDYWQSDGQGGYDPHLTHYYDLVTYTIASGSGTSSTYYLANVAIEGSTSNRWVAHADYDATTRARVRMISPSAVASYTPAGPSSAPSISFRTDDGYVQEYQYTANHRLAAAGVRKGTAGALSLVTRSEFDTERPWLPVKQESLRVEDLTSGNASSSADDIQTVLVRYGFHEDPITEDETDAVAWIEVEFEAELGAENGPGGTHVAHSFFDERGRMHWSRQADDTLTRRTYDDATGALLTSVSNASPTGLPDHPTHAAASWGGRTAQGGSLAVEYVYDTLGRVRSVVSSAGTAIHYVRTLRELDDGRHDDRPGVLHLALVSLPHHWLDGTTDRFAGPANVRYIDAAGATVATVDHTLVAGTADGFGDVVDGYDFELDDQIARSTVTHSLAGMVLRSTQWHSLAGHGENDGYYETIYTYDTLGRLASTQEPGGNISAYDYDERSRVVRVRVGTTTLNLQTVVELFHDSPGTAAHGVGDGVVTLVRTHTGEDSGSEVHDTVLTYDYRNRLVKIKNPAPPHAFVVYDNLDRVVQAAAFSALPAGSDPDDIHDSSTLADRGADTETSYSQRGLA